MTAFIVRMIATAVVLLGVSASLFFSGWLVFNAEAPGFLRHAQVDWSCPRCDLWSTAYVCRAWGPRARRRALGLCHARLSPRCEASPQDLMIL